MADVLLTTVPLNKEDAPAMASCARTSFTNPVDPPWAASAFRDLMMKGAFGWKISVREKGGTEALAGFIFLWDSVEALEVLKVAVRPENRRQGIAKALIARAQGAATERSLPLLLEVAEDNLSARGLYRQCGFRELARRPNYYASALAALVLEWSRTEG